MEREPHPLPRTKEEFLALARAKTNTNVTKDCIQFSYVELYHTALDHIEDHTGIANPDEVFLLNIDEVIQQYVKTLGLLLTALKRPIHHKLISIEDIIGDWFESLNPRELNPYDIAVRHPTDLRNDLAKPITIKLGHSTLFALAKRISSHHETLASPDLDKEITYEFGRTLLIFNATNDRESAHSKIEMLYEEAESILSDIRTNSEHYSKEQIADLKMVLEYQTSPYAKGGILP